MFKKFLLGRLTKSRKARKFFTGKELSSGIGRDDKDLILRANLGGRIAHESDSVDVASESGRQTHLVRIDDTAN